MSATVLVEGISTQTNEDEIRSFFSFCGRIHDLKVTPGKDNTQSATVTFERTTAAQTALLLNDSRLGPNTVHVTSSQSTNEPHEEKTTSHEAKEGDDHDELTQEEKPRSRILAEYLAQGYAISDKAIERALAVDQQHGYSTAFTNALKNFDERFHAAQKAQDFDSKYRLSETVMAGWQGLSSYFDRVVGTPAGQKLRAFYVAGNKTVMDVHNEARHLADLSAKKQSGEHGTSTEKPSAEHAGVEQIPGTNKTKCNCNADAGNCACAPGQCACSGCPKAEATPSAVSA